MRARDSILHSDGPSVGWSAGWFDFDAIAITFPTIFNRLFYGCFMVLVHATLKSAVLVRLLAGYLVMHSFFGLF